MNEARLRMQIGQVITQIETLFLTAGEARDLFGDETLATDLEARGHRLQRALDRLVTALRKEQDRANQSHP